LQLLLGPHTTSLRLQSEYSAIKGQTPGPGPELSFSVRSRDSLHLAGQDLILRLFCFAFSKFLCYFLQCTLLFINREVFATKHNLDL